MLEFIRRQNIGIKVVLGLVVLSFIIFYAGSFSGVDSTDPSRNMGVVGEEQIGFVEYQNMLRMIEQQNAQFTKGEMNEQMRNFFRQQAINTLVDRKLIMLEAEKAGVRASKDEIRRAILESPYFSNNGNFVGIDEYQARVDQFFHTDVEGFENMIAEDLIIAKYNNLLTAAILVGDKEIEDYYRKNNLTAKIDFVIFENASTDEAQVTSEEARAYYDSHKQEFQSGELRKVQYLWISHDSEKNRIQIPDQKVQEYYNTNKSRYARPEQVHARHILLKTEGKDDAAVRAQAEDLVKQLRAGANFEELAKKYSEDEGSAPNGGDLGLFGRGRMVPEFEDAAFSLPVNQISDPVKTQYGYHIIQVTEKQTAYQMEFALVKDQIYRELALPEAMKNAQEQAKRVHEEIAKNKKSMAEISRLQLVELKTTDFFAVNEDIRGLSPAFRESAFALKKKGDTSEPVQVFQDYAILQLMDTKTSAVPPFEKVEAKVTAKVRQSKREELTRAKAQAFYDSIPPGDLKSAAEKAKVTLKSSEEFTPAGSINELGAVPEVTERAFALEIGAISQPVKTPTGFVIFQLKEKKTFDPVDFAAKKDQIRQQMISEKQNEFLQSYRAMLRKKYEKEIWINQEAISPKEA